LGQQVTAELNAAGQWTRGFVYLGGQLVAIQDVPNNRVLWTHQEPFAKSQRITDSSGAIVAGVELEPFGLETNRSFDHSAVSQRRQFTTYDRDANGSDEAMFRRYNRWHDRFDQPDRYIGSMSLANPQSLNRYVYTQNDPVNFVDPTGLIFSIGCVSGWGADCNWGQSSLGFWGGGFNLNARPRAGLLAILEAEARAARRESLLYPQARFAEGTGYGLFSIFADWSPWDSFFGGGNNAFPKRKILYPKQIQNSSDLTSECIKKVNNDFASRIAQFKEEEDTSTRYGLVAAVGAFISGTLFGGGIGGGIRTSLNTIIGIGIYQIRQQRKLRGDYIGALRYCGVEPYFNKGQNAYRVL
jgi:RHS repeat-associated protein